MQTAQVLSCIRREASRSGKLGERKRGILNYLILRFSRTAMIERDSGGRGGSSIVRMIETNVDADIDT